MASLQYSELDKKLRTNVLVLFQICSRDPTSGGTIFEA